MINDAPTTVLPSQAPVAGGFVDPHATTHLQQVIGAGAGAAATQSGAGAAAQRRPQTLNQAKPRKKQSKAIPILVGVLVTALIGATAFILANAFGLIGTTPKPTPTVVTETQITTVPAEPTQAPAPVPRPVKPTTPREEPTSTTKSTTTTSTPVDKPDDSRDADTPPSPRVGTTTTPRTPSDADQPGGDTGTTPGDADESTTNGNTPPAGTVNDTNETSPQP